MNEQRNLYLAIGISIAIIIFSNLIPTQPIDTQSNENDEVLEPAASIDEQNKKAVDEIFSR